MTPTSRSSPRADARHLRDRLLAATHRFSEAVRATTDWEGTFERTPGGQLVPVVAVPVMRLREVEIHHADLGSGYSYGDWSPEFAVQLLDSVTGRSTPEPFVARARDLDREWAFGEGEDRPVVLGDAASLAWWITGRGTGEGLSCDSGVPAYHRGMVTYDGDVTPGGEPQTRDLQGLTLTKVAVDPEMSNNCYLLECQETGACVLVDAAAEPERLLALVGDRELTAVVTTHQHWDHHRALAEVKAAHPGAVVVAGEPDADAITEQTGVQVDRRVAHGDRVEVGTCHLTVVALEGHTPGSIALHWAGGDGHLLSPATPCSPAASATRSATPRPSGPWSRRSRPRSSTSTTTASGSIPGHGGDSTLGAERPHLDEWRERGW